MRLTRVALKLVAAGLVALGVGASVATADVTVPNAYENVAASTAGLNTFIRDVGNPRTGQLLIHANQLTSLVGQNIDGISFRLFTGSTVAYPATAATWTDYTIRVGPGVAFGSQTTTFASNFSGPSTVVRTGPLTIPASAFPGAGGPPRPFGPFIAFTTPFPYTGGNLVVEIRHTGSNITNNPANDFLEVALTTDPGFNNQFWCATATSATATTGAQANFTVARLRGVGSATINAGDGSVTEGNAGPVNLLVPVTLAAPAVAPVTVAFATANDTATAGTDYTATSGTLTFAPGETSKNVTVSVTGDTVDELDETFFVNLSSPTGGVIGDGQGVGTIIDDDGPAISIGDLAQLEGNAGPNDAILPVTLSAASPGTVTVAFTTADGTATAPSDYTTTSGVLTFAPGTTALGVTVSINGDVVPEADETYFVNLSAATGGATIADPQGLGTIVNDDGGPDTTGELSHRFRVLGDLASTGGTPDEDTYSISQDPFSSYEVVVDAASGDVSPVVLDRRDGTTVLQTSLPIGMGTGQSLRWANDTSNTVASETVRVASGGCTTDCGSDDTYRLRSYETTYSIPRFNNAGTQVTVLILQNPTDYPVTATVYFWNAAGAQLHAEPLTLAAKNIVVLNTASIGAVNGQSGAITITNNGRFGDLSGKTVALEPATGFSFDSPMIAR